MSEDPKRSSSEDPRDLAQNQTSESDESETIPLGHTDTTRPVTVGQGAPGDSQDTEATRPLSHSEEDTAPMRARRPAKPSAFGGPAATVASAARRPRDPLPQRVNEVDIDATRVSSAAYTPPPPQAPRYPTPGPRRPATQPQRPPPPPTPPRDRAGCLLRTIFTSLFLIIFVALCGLSIAFYQYYRIASTLPDIDDLRQNASQFETTRILDRNGDVLYEIIDPNAGRRTYVTLDKISPYLVAATIATEDKGFYSHPGFDPIAIARAFWQNYQGGEIISGASTITQQLARNLLFTPEERIDQSYQRKIREAVLAAEITRRYSKDEILELYLNENFYGNLSYGIEAAAETYFNTTSDKLTLGEASFLAGLPQAPSIYDVYTNPEAAFSRHDDVLVLMYETSQEQGCIYVSNQPQPICLDPAKVTIAAAEIREYPFDTPDIQMRYPHWVNYVRALLEAQYDPQTIYRSGFTVFTTLDPALQDIAQAAVQEQIQSMTGQNAGSGALVIIRPTTGEILTMVGSADFYNEDISGQVNMAVNPRQPGSSIKPLTYLASFEQGLTPASLVWDVPSEFPPSGQPDDPRPPYKPVNYDGRFHGPVTLRYALANSYNIPAVKVLDYVGIYDDPATPQEEGLIPFARRMGITTLNRSDYGLSLTLGGGEVTLLEMTGAYAVFANNGRRIPPVAITRILDSDGNLVYEYQPNPGEQVIRPEHAYLISSILADNQARTPAFGANSVLNLPFPAAAKTGTTNDIRDNWTIGYTPDLAVGVWVGNPDYTPMVNTSGLAGAAPIWSNVMQAGMGHVVGDNPTPFNRPGGVVERVICEVSGTLPSQWCPQQRSEIFAADQPPLPKEEDLWQKVVIDTWTGLRASAACPDFTDEKFVLNVSDSWAKKWIRKDPDGQKWAKGMGFEKPVTFTPSRECRADDPRPRLVFTSPQENMTITTSPLDIYGIVDATHGFDFMRLEYGLGDKPVEWQLLAQSRDRLSNPGLIHSWDVSLFPPERVTLRLTIRGTEDNYAETSTHLTIQVPTPTPTPTPTATFTPTPSPTPEPTLTPTFTSTLPPSPSPTITLPPLPTIAFPTETPTPSLTPTATPTE